jgi:hypothetical protein
VQRNLQKAYSLFNLAGKTLDVRIPADRSDRNGIAVHLDSRQMRNHTFHRHQPLMQIFINGSGLTSVRPSDDCCGLRTKFCVAKEAGLARVGLEHPRLFDELTPPRVRNIFPTVYRITKNREDAEDALQDAFLQALVHFGDFDGL